MPDETPGEQALTSGPAPGQAVSLYGTPPPATVSAPFLINKAEISILPAPISAEFIDTLERHSAGATHRILIITEKEQSQRHKLAWADMWTTRLGMSLGALLLAGLIIGATILGLHGDEVAAAAMLGGPAIAGAIAFIGRGGINIGGNSNGPQTK